MAKVENLQRLLATLKRRRENSRNQDDVSVIVGYTADYSAAVHENLEARHPVGQAKFLEEPFREMVGDLVEQVKEDVGNGKPLRSALLKAGLKLQAASQRLCPVDTGNMRGSAFTRVEEREQ